MGMDGETEVRLMQAVEKWAEGHPAPDVPAIRILGQGAMTPRQVVEAMRDRSPAGELLLQVLENAVAETTLEDVLGSFDKGLAQSRAVGHGD